MDESMEASEMSNPRYAEKSLWSITLHAVTAKPSGRFKEIMLER
jgi:hypothetical protein